MVRVKDAGVELHLLAKYIDDINLVIMRLSLGTRWEGSKLAWSEEWEQQDRDQGRSQEVVTMEAMRCAADSVMPWLRFTMDLPEKHESQTVPVLDIQVWVHHPQDHEEGLGLDIIRWAFYEKPMASLRVLNVGSAYTLRQKLTAMYMELFRCLRNSSRQLTMEAKLAMMKTFVTKLRRSGYG